LDLDGREDFDGDAMVTDLALEAVAGGSFVDDVFGFSGR
jgi:hypothetical protein